MLTVHAHAGEVERRWMLVDAQDEVLGRLASRIALVLRGKHKPVYTPHLDTGDFVVVVNIEKVAMTGRKWDQKVYYRHTKYPGGIRETSATRMRDEHPDRMLYLAVRGMLPKNRLGRAMIKKLKIYAGPEHPHAAQKPEPIVLTKKQ